jgi:hypothetical protein
VPQNVYIYIKVLNFQIFFWISLRPICRKLETFIHIRALSGTAIPIVLSEIRMGGKRLFGQ